MFLPLSLQPIVAVSHHILDPTQLVVTNQLFYQGAGSADSGTALLAASNWPGEREDRRRRRRRGRRRRKKWNRRNSRKRRRKRRRRRSRRRRSRIT